MDGRCGNECSQHAHDRFVLHGDLKPSNVLVTPGGTPMLLDFNLSHDGQRETIMTGGTMPYMSPEQLRAFIHDENRDNSKIDERSDI